jgi:hypothetical protein
MKSVFVLIGDQIVVHDWAALSIRVLEPRHTPTNTRTHSRGFSSPYGAVTATLTASRRDKRVSPVSRR